ncbi:unnamed protein product [Sphagnum balticum]
MVWLCHVSDLNHWVHQSPGHAEGYNIPISSRKLVATWVAHGPSMIKLRSPDRKWLIPGLEASSTNGSKKPTIMASSHIPNGGIYDGAPTPIQPDLSNLSLVSGRPSAHQVSAAASYTPSNSPPACLAANPRRKSTRKHGRSTPHPRCFHHPSSSRSVNQRRHPQRQPPIQPTASQSTTSSIATTTSSRLRAPSSKSGAGAVRMLFSGRTPAASSPSTASSNIRSFLAAVHKVNSSNTANSPIPASASSDTSGFSKVGHATTTAPAPSAATSHSSASYLTLTGFLNDYQSGFGVTAAYRPRHRNCPTLHQHGGFFIVIGRCAVYWWRGTGALGIGYNGRVDDGDDGDDAAQIRGMVEGRRNSAGSTSMYWRIEVVD